MISGRFLRNLVPAKLSLAAAGIALMLGCQSYSKRQTEREWQALNDTIAECSQKISNIVRVIQQSPHTTEATQQRLLHDIDSIDQRMKAAIRRCAERNQDNELGDFIRKNYSEE